MSASQLIRILQTLPADDDDDDICAFNTDDLDKSMNKSSNYTNPFLCDEQNNDITIWNTHEDEKFSKSLFEKTTPFYIDKNSVECELPELMVCYKESDFQVKDICIDEDNGQFVSNSDPVNGDDDMIETRLDTEFLNQEWLKPSSMTDCCMGSELKSSLGSEIDQNASDNYGLESLTDTCYEKLDDISRKQLAFSSELPEFPESSDDYAEDVSRQAFRPFQVFVKEMEANVAFNFDTGKPATASGRSRAMNRGSSHEPSVDTRSGLNLQDVGSGNVAVASKLQYGEESSFSMAGVVSELISCSRRIPFSGNLSTRSDSSATSTRSFAFPTLQTEWNSSPARMGKAERRRLQKQRGWRQGLLCCRF